MSEMNSLNTRANVLRNQITAYIIYLYSPSRELLFESVSLNCKFS